MGYAFRGILNRIRSFHSTVISLNTHKQIEIRFTNESNILIPVSKMYGSVI